MKRIARSMEIRPGYLASGGRRGQAGLFVVFNLTLVFGTLGLAVDVGWAYYTRQSAQAAADAAAMAAVSWASSSGKPVCGTGGVTCNSTAAACANPPTTPPTTDLQVGCLYAQQNGFVNNGTTQFVTMAGNTTAPPGIANNSPTYWVQANVTATPYTLFGGFGGIRRFTINASAIAAVSYHNPGACIYVLDPTVSQAFSATGASTVTATSCGIFVNSSSSSAFYEHGSPSVTASQILINGGASISVASSVSPNPPTTNAGAVSDPLANLTLPSFSNVCPNPPYTPYTLAGTSVAVLPSGNYCGGITISHSSQATFSGGTYYIWGGLTVEGASTATFDSGMYIVNGGGISFANSAAISGSGVTFYNTAQYGQTIGGVSNTGATTVTLSAPSSGTYQGMLFMQDRNPSNATSISFANSASTSLTGTLYFPTCSLTYSGASASATYTAIVADTVSFTGSAAFKNDPTGTHTGLASTVRGLIQ
jgi:Putative Flp pilus-assembly TadE/G-like